MIELISLPTDFTIDGMKKVCHLVEYEGPLISIMEHTDGSRYLYYWCDCDSVCNRWLAMRIGEVVPDWHDVDLSQCLDNFVHVVDIDDDLKARNIFKLDIAAVPIEYTPTRCNS